MNVTPSSTARRSTRTTSSWSRGSPHTPGPGICMAPYPSRTIGRSPPMANSPLTRAGGVEGLLTTVLPAPARGRPVPWQPRSPLDQPVDREERHLGCYALQLSEGRAERLAGECLEPLLRRHHVHDPPAGLGRAGDVHYPA